MPTSLGSEEPKPSATRKHADEVSRIAAQAGTSAARFLADLARYGSRVGGRLARAIEDVPPTLRLLVLVGVLMLVGIVGAISMHNPLGLICIVVVVPLCSITLGAIGHRWYSGLDGRHTHQAPTQRVEVPAPDLQRSVEYVDTKLALALNSFSAERHQHAMIALVQAKTAVELALGTEQEASPIDALLAVEDTRPRIRPGSASKTLLREHNSLAAS